MGISTRTDEEPMAPARVSIKLNQTASAAVDVPFCLTVPPKAKISYSGYGYAEGSCFPGRLYAESDPVGSFPGLTEDAAELPIADIAAGSTAVASGVHMFKPLVGIEDGLSNLDLRPATWTSLARR